MYWGSGEANVEERMEQSVIESFKALSLIPWFGRDFLLTLIQALAVHVLLIWIYFFLNFTLKGLICDFSVAHKSKCQSIVMQIFPCLAEWMLSWGDGAQVKQRGGRAEPSMAASSCKHCQGWALQVVFALCKVGSSVVQSSPVQHRDVPKLGTQSRESHGTHFTSPVSSPKLATNRCSLPYCMYISLITSAECRARNLPDQMLH